MYSVDKKKHGLIYCHMSRRLAMLMGEGTSHEASSSQALERTIAPKKMTPRKAKRNLQI